MTLDDKDQLLLTVLNRRARITNRELAEQVGLSQSACLARVKRLEKADVILAYRAVVAHGRRGSRLEGWAHVRLIRPTPVEIEQFKTLVMETSAVIEVHHVAGDFDYILHFLSNDATAWKNFQVGLACCVDQSESRFSILLDTLK